jgi:2-polyprenyl-6-methoxyphenol hydroxylase-like FAD-dependent oxidoreductase
MQVAIIGGGIGGLSLALMLEAAGFGKNVRVYEAVSEIRALGVGINLAPHAMKTLGALGLLPALREVAVEPLEFTFFTALGQLVYSEPAGVHAGYPMPHLSIHRGDLQMVLLAAVIERLGPEAVVCGHRCIGVDQDADGVDVRFVDTRGNALPSVRADVAIGCDGIHSAIRQQFYPDEGPPVFHGVNMWRGVTKAKAFLTGRSHVRIGGLNTTNKIVIYPIRDNIDGNGTQLINWNTEVVTDNLSDVVDWNKPGTTEDAIAPFKSWVYDWIDVPQLIRDADINLSFPMVDRDPVGRYTFGRVTLLGDAAHPMYPRGGNGGAQSILDARVLTDLLVTLEPRAALEEYDRVRVPAVSAIVERNRTAPPDVIIDTVERLTQGKRFEKIEDVIDPAKLREMSQSYRRLVGSDLASVGGKGDG